ncbi:hypothetical protein CDAR_251651 [Caerostris darwini]|uniref:Uncharacterized protein n=1 Tax=Caerostris darwini TaxID=1538125 RepID=A0AAV4U163_9ARAC|nr:hypothetical protein CDAR_251651 [Caerostris darwini]
MLSSVEIVQVVRRQTASSLCMSQELFRTIIDAEWQIVSSSTVYSLINQTHLPNFAVHVISHVALKVFTARIKVSICSTCVFLETLSSNPGWRLRPQNSM